MIIILSLHVKRLHWRDLWISFIMSVQLQWSWIVLRSHLWVWRELHWLGMWISGESSLSDSSSLYQAPATKQGLHTMALAVLLFASNRSRTLLLVLLLKLLNPHISLSFSHLSTELRSTKRTEYKLPASFSYIQSSYLAILTIWSLFNPLTVPAPHLLSPFLSPVMSRVTSSFTCQLISIIITTLHHLSLLHSFTPGSKPTFSTNPSHLRLLLPTGLPHDNGTGPDLTGPITLISLFLVSHFNFFVYSVW